MASSSKSYDVFLNFRGPDVRNNFVSHLHVALEQKGIDTYMDSEELEKGEQITPAIMKAIKESQIAIVVFSEDYASSSFCLDELANIMECKEQKKLLAWPVFHKLEPREVRTPREIYKNAMAKQEAKFWNDPEKIERWSTALSKAGNLFGWHFHDGDNEAKLIQDIVQNISTQIDRSPLTEAKYLVGIDSRVQELETILKLESKGDVFVVVLWGKGGIGKTTLAKAIYNAVFKEFQGSSFLEGVRENSKKLNDLAPLQAQLLSEVLLGKKSKVNNVAQGSQLIQKKFFKKKVLIILDDVDAECQLNALAGDLKWFGKGSRIIITTRDVRLLTFYEGDSNHLYNVEALNNDEALDLFGKHARLRNEEEEIKSDLVKSVLRYASCLPLALVVLGSFLRHRGEKEWESTLEKFQKNPPKKIKDVLKVSYDGLEDHEKEIFLDIACFFRGQRTCYTKKILNSCGFEATIEIKLLIERSLISEERGIIKMHDLIQLMGMDIVRAKYRHDPEKRSRLWLRDDVRKVLSRNAETTEVKAIVLELPKQEDMHIDSNAFTKIKKLRLLILHNVHNSVHDPIHLPNELKWFGWAHCASIPEFGNGPKELVGLDMRNSKIKVGLEQFKGFENLKFIHFSECHLLVYMPDLNFTPNLEELDLHGCKNLEYAHESIAYHDKLRLLNLSGCSKLHHFPNILRSKHLELLNLNHCSKLERFPDIPDKINLQGLYLIGTSIVELPTSIKNLVSLEEMDLRYCKELAILPSSIYRLLKLERLMLEGCSKLVQFPKEEYPSDSHMKTGFPKLYVLNLRGCSLSNLEFLENHSCFPFLRALYLLGNDCTNLPTYGQLYNLPWLDVSHCQQLPEIPHYPGRLRHLWAIGCESLSRFPPDKYEVEDSAQL